MPPFSVNLSDAVNIYISKQDIINSSSHEH